MLEPVPAPSASSETTVAAGRDLAFTMDMQNAVVFCISTRSFQVPRREEHHVMYPQEAPRGCDVLGLEGSASHRSSPSANGSGRGAMPGPFCEALK